jgi:hypothetical protein
MDRKVHEVWEGQDWNTGAVLHQLCQLPGVLDGMKVSLVWFLLYPSRGSGIFHGATI